MNEEIKEILEYLKDDFWEFHRNDGTSYKHFFREERDKLLDYITNLQEENNELKNLEYKFFDCSGDEESFTLNDYLELGNKVYDLQEENETLKAKLELYKGTLHNEHILTKRIDKAVEYIENTPLYETTYDYNTEEELEIQNVSDETASNTLLDILNGRSGE